MNEKSHSRRCLLCDARLYRWQRAILCDNCGQTGAGIDLEESQGRQLAEEPWEESK